MTPVQIQLLQRSYETVQPVSAAVGASFYQKLFESVPNSRDVFEADGDAHWRVFLSVVDKMLQSDLRSMLTVPVTQSGSKELSIPGVAEMADWYAEEGSRPEYVAAGRDALLWSLDHHLGDDLDAETADAWAKAYDLITGSMLNVINAEAIDPALPDANGRTAPDSQKETLELLFNQ